MPRRAPPETRSTTTTTVGKEEKGKGKHHRRHDRGPGLSHLEVPQPYGVVLAGGDEQRRVARMHGDVVDAVAVARKRLRGVAAAAAAKRRGLRCVACFCCCCCMACGVMVRSADSVRVDTTPVKSRQANPQAAVNEHTHTQARAQKSWLFTRINEASAAAPRLNTSILQALLT